MHNGLLLSAFLPLFPCARCTRGSPGLVEGLRGDRLSLMLLLGVVNTAALFVFVSPNSHLSLDRAVTDKKADGGPRDRVRPAIPYALSTVVGCPGGHHAPTHDPQAARRSPRWPDLLVGWLGAATAWSIAPRHRDAVAAAFINVFLVLFLAACPKNLALALMATAVRVVLRKMAASPSPAQHIWVLERRRRLGARHGGIEPQEEISSARSHPSAGGSRQALSLRVPSTRPPADLFVSTMRQARSAPPTCATIRASALGERDSAQDVAHQSVSIHVIDDSDDILGLVLLRRAGRRARRRHAVPSSSPSRMTPPPFPRRCRSVAHVFNCATRGCK